MKLKLTVQSPHIIKKKKPESLTFREKEKIQPKVSKLKLTSTPNKFIQDVTMEAFSYWNEFGTVEHQTGTITYSKAIGMLNKLFKGTLYRGYNEIPKEYHYKKFTLEDFMLSIDKFKESLSPKFYPKYKKHLKTLGLIQFLYNDRGTGEIKSQFLHYYENDLQLLEPIIDDRFPSLTSSLKKLYVKEIQHGIKASLSGREENTFRKASFMLMNVFRINQSKLLPRVSDKPGIMTDVLWEALKQASGRNISKINVYWFVGDWVYDKIPEAINKLGLFRQRNTI